jgi:hypothetical protein
LAGLGGLVWSCFAGVKAETEIGFGLGNGCGIRFAFVFYGFYRAILKQLPHG